MKKICFLSISCLALLSSSAFAAGSHSANNIAECAKLLPQDGKQYELNLKVVIDKDRASTGDLTISDDSKRELSDKEKAMVKPYIDCVKRLTK